MTHFTITCRACDYCRQADNIAAALHAVRAHDGHPISVALITNHNGKAREVTRVDAQGHIRQGTAP